MDLIKKFEVGYQIRYLGLPKEIKYDEKMQCFKFTDCLFTLQDLVTEQSY